MLLMIDNYDSFTFNLVQYFAELGEDVRVVRNDEITLEEIEALAPQRIVLSPGPCSPQEAGICVPAVRHYSSLPDSPYGQSIRHPEDDCPAASAFAGQLIRLPLENDLDDVAVERAIEVLHELN